MADLTGNRVRLEMRNFNKIRGMFNSLGGLTTRSPIKKMLNRWGFRYQSFSRRRYINLSRSGGDGAWAPLAKSTIRGRRKGKAKGKSPAILVDTGQMRDALQPGGFGGMFERRRKSVLIGFTPAPRADGTTIADLATFHHFGMGNNPERKILVEQDEATNNGMISDAKKAAKEMDRLFT